MAGRYGPLVVVDLSVPRRRRHNGNTGLLQVNNDVRIGPDVVDPVTSTVGSGHPGDEASWGPKVTSR